ncbi:MAG: hypothetical protein ACPGUV_00250 [Polyangiales bacterium]
MLQFFLMTMCVLLQFRTVAWRCGDMIEAHAPQGFLSALARFMKQQGWIAAGAEAL